MIDHWSRIGRLLIRTALLSVLTVIEVLLTLLIMLLTLLIGRRLPDGLLRLRILGVSAGSVSCGGGSACLSGSFTYRNRSAAYVTEFGFIVQWSPAFAAI